jgi:hypothetical protein
VKTICMLGLLASAAVAHADSPKPATAPGKLGGEARVFVMVKEAPPLDKTVALARLRPALKNK